MSNILLRPLAHFASVLRHSAPVHAGVACLGLVLAAPASAEPFSTQQWAPGTVAAEAEGTLLPNLSPFYETGLTRTFDEESWRESRSDLAGGGAAPTGFIASIGRFGLKVDGSGADGPKINGIAWAPTEALSVVAGGDLGGAGGIGASLSLRWSF